jgi:hypothetical protein
MERRCFFGQIYRYAYSGIGGEQIMKYDEKWCRENPGLASGKIESLWRLAWSNASEACARKQIERDALRAELKVYSDRIERVDSGLFGTDQDIANAMASLAKAGEDKECRSHEDGLPPIGDWVEIAESSAFLRIGYQAGTQVKIYSHFVDDRGVELAAFVCALGKVGGVATAECFRAIQTDREKAIESAEKLINALPTNQTETAEQVFGALYDAGMLSRSESIDNLDPEKQSDES